jgi:hypothetical protein
MNDLSILENPILLTNDYDLLLQDLYILLNTEQGSIPFDYNFGVSLNKYVHELNADSKEIKNHIISQISVYCNNKNNLTIDIEVSFFQEAFQDICLIDIYIEKQKEFGLLI